MPFVVSTVPALVMSVVALAGAAFVMTVVAPAVAAFVMTVALAWAGVERCEVHAAHVV